MCFTGDKAAISADLHVEDSPAAAIDLALAGQQTILMDRTYNRGITGILRVRAWEELIGVIAAMMNPL